MESHSVAHVVGSTLAHLGVDTVFGLAGSGNFVVTNALVAGGARFVSARHEGGAVAMADGWARTTGRVGVASVHQGPGLTNTLTALAEAAKAHTPLVLVAGDTPPAALHSNFRIDQHDLVRAVGAAPELVSSPATAAADAARALRRAQLERRPVVLMMPIDTAAAAAAPEATPITPEPLPASPAPAAHAVARAADVLAAAQRPLIIAGRGAVLADAGRPIDALGERTGALLATSAMANGLFAELPYALGIAGGFASPLAARLLAQSDVILSLGAGLNHWTTRHGALLAGGARLIQVDVNAAAIGVHQPAEVAIVADAAAAATALLAELDARGHRSTGRRTPEVCAAIAAGRWRAEPYDDNPPPDTIDPRTLAIALNDLLPRDRAIAVDSGAFTGWPAMYLDVADPHAWLFCNAFQSVGLGFGAALGAAVARPDRVTVAALGDGGMFLSLPELDTAARLGLPVLVVVWNDAAYGAEVHHFAPMGQDVTIARFPDPDLAAIARGAGIAAHTIRGATDLAPVATWAADPSGPLLLDAKVDPTVAGDWLAEAFRGG
ncbi:MAG TPA: thiamine pyrophosphate-binding protein [Solirubrobacteraceae bacterium]|nr:thiamine pyrophosphate-binding protein [Solirubrobacteraceae bacterium]